MKKLFPIALSSGIIAAIWAITTMNYGLNTFAGFLAWSTYFSTQGGKKGLKTTLICNISGASWGVIIVFLNNLLIPYIGPIASVGLSTAFGAIFIILQSNIKILYYIPATFIGLSAFFASGNDYQSTVIALIIGGFLGIISDKFGKILDINLST